MSLSSTWLDELKSRVTLSSLIGQSLKLEKAGREFKGLCPFHGEKTPSFTISDAKGFYHCYGCGAHGDAIRWLSEHRGLPFMDAVRELAAGVGMDVPAPSPEAQARAARIDGLRPALDAAQAVYARELEQCGAAREWLAARGIGEAEIATFGLGYAPARVRWWRDAGVSDELAIEAGICWRSETGAVGDMMRGRVTVPVADARGRMLGFTGRVHREADAMPGKWVNTRETDIFDKGSTLFNLHRAAGAQRAFRRLILVEGQFDCVAMTRAGFAEVVAPMGTSLTERQLERMWRVDPCPVMLFDGDAAGDGAALRAAELALPHAGPGRSLRFASLPHGSDPDDLVQRAADMTAARDAIEVVLGAAEDMVDFIFRRVAGVAA